MNTDMQFEKPVQCEECISYRYFNFFFISDVDECLTFPCGVNKVCINQPGTYVCQCAQGYSGDGRTCTPIGKNMNL